MKTSVGPWSGRARALTPSPQRFPASRRWLKSVAVSALFSSPFLFGQLAPPPATGAPEANGTTAEEPVVMDPFAVSGSSDVGYGAMTTSSSGALVQNYIDVPQTVNVLTSEFMQDLNLDDSRMALEFVPGVFAFSSINPGSYFIRGSSLNASYVDGMLLSGESAGSPDFGSFNLPTEFFDRVEVVKGPSSAAFGLGEPGGIINYVSKTPDFINQTNISVAGGDNSNYRFVADAQGFTGNLAYRLVLVDAHGFEYIGPDIQHGQIGAQLALKYRVNPKVQLQWIVCYSQTLQPGLDDGQSAYATVTGAEANNPGLLPIPGYKLAPGQVALPYFAPYSDSESAIGSNTSTIDSFRSNLIATANLNDNISVRNAFFIGNQVNNEQSPLPDDELLEPSPGLYESSELTLPFYDNSTQVRDQVDIVAKFDTKFGNYTTLLGGEAYSMHLFSNVQLGIPSLPNNAPYYVNIYNPGQGGSVENYLSSPSDFISLGQEADYYKGGGFYIQEQANYWNDMLQLMAGWRIDYLNYSTLVYGTPNTVSNPGWENTKGAPRFAITVKPLSWLSAYGLYTVHKDPTQSNQVWTIVGEPLPTSIVPNPQAIEFYQPGGTTIEGGLKALLLNGNVTASLAVYHSLDTGTIVATQNNTYTEPDGTISSYEKNLVTGSNVHGVEMQVTGVVSRRLIFDASYAYCRGTTPINGGLIDEIDPPTSFAFHGKYDFGDLHGNGFFVTGGFRLFSPYWYKENFTTDEINLATGKSGDLVSLYWNSWQYSVDAGVGYQWAHGRQKLYLNCDNMTNQFVEFGPSFAGNSSTLPFRQTWLTYSLSFR